MRAGALVSEGVSTSCPHDVALSTVQRYARPPVTARGGGPVLASPAYCGPNGAVIQRPDRYAPLPFAPPVNPPLDYGTPRANPPQR